MLPAAVWSARLGERRGRQRLGLEQVTEGKRRVRKVDLAVTVRVHGVPTPDLAAGEQVEERVDRIRSVGRQTEVEWAREQAAATKS